MDKNLMDQFIHVNTTSQHSTRQKAHISKQKAITQPLTAHMHRDHLFTSNMAQNGLVPTNMQERLMKEAVMHEQRGGGHKLQN